jgi:hypothetical protein
MDAARIYRAFKFVYNLQIIKLIKSITNQMKLILGIVAGLFVFTNAAQLKHHNTDSGTDVKQTHRGLKNHKNNSQG